MNGGDIALAVITGLGLGVAFVGCVVSIYRTYKAPALKTSRSDTDLTGMIDESMP